jgi:hypothetical protein
MGVISTSVMWSECEVDHLVPMLRMCGHLNLYSSTWGIVLTPSHNLFAVAKIKSNWNWISNILHITSLFQKLTTKHSITNHPSVLIYSPSTAIIGTETLKSLIIFLTYIFYKCLNYSVRFKEKKLEIWHNIHKEPNQTKGRPEMLKSISTKIKCGFKGLQYSKTKIWKGTWLSKYQ